MDPKDLKREATDKNSLLQRAYNTSLPKTILPKEYNESEVAKNPENVPVTRAERTMWAMNDVMRPAYMVTMSTEIDATSLVLLRESIRTQLGKAPSFTALVIKAAQMLMKNNPNANRAILGPPFFKRLYQFRSTDISVAVEKDLPGQPGQAFAVPIRNTSGKSLNEISEDLKELAHCTEENNHDYKMFMRILKYIPTRLALLLINAPYWVPALWRKHRGCACWVNAPSKAGVDSVWAIWPWPITVSFGLVKKRPFVVDGKLEVRYTMPLIFVFDRRIMGGGPASRLFLELQKTLQSAHFDQNKN